MLLKNLSLDTLYSFTIPDPQKGCLVWQGPCNAKGYPQVTLEDGKTYSVTRLVWGLSYGEWPDNFVLHTCDYPPCIHIGHLFLGDAKDNNDDLIAKFGSWKLKDEQVLEMRKRNAAGESVEDLAREYNTTEMAAWRAISGQTYKHLNT